MSVVWITGGHGFIGKELAKHCRNNGDDVYGIGHKESALAVEMAYAYWLTSDIDETGLERLKTQSSSPDVIYHLAGGSSVGASIVDPRHDFERTVTTTSQLLDWVRIFSPQTKVVCASSAAIYGASFSGLITEKNFGVPYSPYGFHKAMQESLCQSYIEAYDLKISIVRLFSVYGPGLQKQLVWDLCNKLKVNRGGVSLQGSGRELRDWIHITDAVRLLRHVASIKGNVVLNGGTGIATSIAEIAMMISNAWGQNHEIGFTGLERKGDTIALIAEPSRLKQMGFEHEIDLNKGINDVVSWFQETQL